MSRLHRKLTHVVVLALLPSAACWPLQYLVSRFLGITYCSTQRESDSMAFSAQTEGQIAPLSQLVDAHCEITLNATRSDPIRNQIWRSQPAQMKLAITVHVSNLRTAKCLTTCGSLAGCANGHRVIVDAVKRCYKMWRQRCAWIHASVHVSVEIVHPQSYSVKRRECENSLSDFCYYCSTHFADKNKLR